MTGGENRRRSIIKALRKKKIAEDIYGFLHRDYAYYDNLHQYSKNKIHCSCPMCAQKTNGTCISRFKRFVPGSDYKISDVRKLQRMEESEKEDMVP